MSEVQQDQKQQAAGGIVTKDRKTLIKENVVSLGLALLVVFMIRSSIIESFKIPSGSMIPTLAIGDYVFVNKFAYGIKLPFSEWVTDPVYLVKRDPPQRGDVIVFRFPKDESIYFIKRVVGVPGDTIELRDKVLYLNQKPVTRIPLDASHVETVTKQKALADPQYTVTHPDFYDEKLGNVDHMMMMDKDNFQNPNFGPVTVPPESFFAMGDNRDVSNDSRFWGFVPMKNIAGKAMVVWFSVWADLSGGNFFFHPERIGTTLTL